MNLKIKAIIAIVSATLCAFCPAAAKAERIYFLVGVRHVYEIGPDRDLHLSEREEIEKNYADGVAEDQDTFNKHMANGGDRDKESDLLNADLDALADARDKSLGSLFNERDDLRDRHEELRIGVDGPYQVIGVEMHETGDTEVIDRYAVYAPWPGYVVVGGCYGDWDYGVWYTPGIFIDLYWGWFGRIGDCRFCPGFCGHFGRVDFAPHGFIDHSRFAGSGRFGRSASPSFGGSRRSADTARGWGSNRSSASGYSHSLGGSHSAGTGRTGAWSRYSHSNSSSGFSRSNAAGGYSHSSSGSFSRGTASGGTSHSSGYSGYSHVSSSGWGRSSHSTDGGSYSRSSGSSYGGRSGGFSRSSSSGGQDRGSPGGWGGSHSSGSRSGGSAGSSSGGGHSGGGSGGHSHGR